MVRFSSATVLIGLACIGAGCARYQARPLDREATLEELRATRLEGMVVKRSALDQRGLAMPQLDLADGLSEEEVVSIALTLNPDLKAKRLEIGEAQSLLVAAGIWPNPELGVSVGHGIGGASGYTVGMDLLFELLRPNERSARKQAAQAQVDAKRAEVAAEEFRLATEARTGLLNVLAAEASVSQLTQATTLRQRVADLLRERREAGDVTELERSAAEMELGQVQRELREARREVANARRDLNRLMGLPPDYVLQLTDAGKPLEIRTAYSLASEDLERRMLTGRFELRAREADYQRTEQELRLAMLRQYPRVSLGPTFERELEGDKSLGLGASIELPLLDRNQGEIAEKQAQRDQLRQAYTAALHQLRAECAAAYAGLRQAEEELAAQEKDLLPLVRRNEELFEGAFRAGEVPVLDWITAQERTLEARREYLKAAIEYRKAVIALEGALGLPLNRPIAPAPASQPAAQHEAH